MPLLRRMLIKFISLLSSRAVVNAGINCKTANLIQFVSVRISEGLLLQKSPKLFFFRSCRSFFSTHFGLQGLRKCNQKFKTFVCHLLSVGCRLPGLYYVCTLELLTNPSQIWSRFSEHAVKGHRRNSVSGAAAEPRPKKYNCCCISSELTHIHSGHLLVALGSVFYCCICTHC